MVQQTTKMNGSGSTESSPFRGATSGLGVVVGTGIDLAALQLRLAKTDATKAAKQLKPALVAGVIAFGMILSSLTLLGLGIASFLSEASALRLWQSQLIVGASFLLLAGVLLAFCWSALKRMGTAFNRTQHEAQQNLQWLRHAIGQISR